MIKKILKIQNVGKFKNFPLLSNSGHWTQELRRAVLIYGENGTGKTTLAHLFKSLQAGNTHLNKKKSFDATGDCLVELRIEGQSESIRFNGTSWSHPCDEIEVFDSHFISENVFTGHEIQSGHEKNLFELIIGKRGVGLKGTITGLKTIIETNTGLLRDAKQFITLKTGNGIKPEAFIKLRPVGDLAAQVNLNEAELSKARNLAEIRRAPVLLPLPLQLPAYPIEKLRKVYPFTIEQISDEYLEVLSAHKEHLDMADKEGWLANGWKNAQNSPQTCPFCQQGISEQIGIIKTYSLHFNAKYARLKQELDKMEVAFGGNEVDQALHTILQLVMDNTTRGQFWQPYIGIILLSAEELIQEIKTTLTQQVEVLLHDTTTKKQDLSLSLPLATVDGYTEAIAKVNALIEQYNAIVAHTNEAIERIKTSKGASEADLLKEKDALQLQLLRTTEEMEEACLACTDLNELIAGYKKQMEGVKGQLEEYAKDTLTLYADKINFYLAKFASYIKIERLKHEYRGSGKDPYATYGLLVHDHEVAFVEQTDDDGPSLKHSLSEGDKSALAFSFFLAKLDLDGTLANKIIVFDDPISSFDAGRKTATIGVLSSLSKRAKQLLVLTHNLFFASELLERLEDNATAIPCLSLKIKHSGAGSVFKEHDLDAETTLGFLKDYASLTDFVENELVLDEQQKRGAIKCIRTVLEGYLRFKFVRKLGKNEWLGNALTKIRDADTHSPFLRLKPHLDTLEELNNYSKNHHHASLNLGESESINDAELKQYAMLTIEVVQHI